MNQYIPHAVRRVNHERLHITSTTFAAYLGVFLLVVALVAIGYQPPQRGQSPIANAVNSSDTSLQPSVDQVVAATVAANMATRAQLPVAANLSNMSVSLAAESRLDQTNPDSISKPQIVQPNADSRAVRSYVVKKGDTVESVAKQFGISTDTVRWANNLDSDNLIPGKKLKIMPTDGVLHVVQSGDTASSLAREYHANKEVIVATNDLENKSKLSVGQQLIIPRGILPVNQRPGYEAPASYSGGTANFGGGYGIDASMANASAGNRYAFGNCTWYAYNRRAELGRPVGSFWGNASTWAAYARAAGYTVNNSPAPGAVMQSTGGYSGFGHVAIVERVDPGGQGVYISEMNAYRWGGGFDRIDHGWISWSEATSGMYSYIH